METPSSPKERIKSKEEKNARTTKRKYMKSQKVNTRHNSFVSVSALLAACSILYISRTNGIRTSGRERHTKKKTQQQQQKQKPKPTDTHTHTPGQNTSRKLFIDRIFLHYFLWAFRNACPMCVWPFHSVVFHLNFIFWSAKSIVRSVPIFVSAFFCFFFISFRFVLCNFSLT